MCSRGGIIIGAMEEEYLVGTNLMVLDAVVPGSRLMSSISIALGGYNNKTISR